jgi:hypothetical protein
MRGTAVGNPTTVYTLQQVETGLNLQPSAWLQRQIRVRATPFSGACFFQPYGPACAYLDDASINTDNSFVVTPLLLRTVTSPFAIAFLRRVPLLGAIAPATQVMHMGVPGTYRIQIQITSCHDELPPHCYVALLPDAIG